MKNIIKSSLKNTLVAILLIVFLGGASFSD